jgi:primosomal protein N' (replication factor Y)
MPPTVRVAALEGPRASVDAAIAALRDAVPALDDEAILGPVTADAGARALVRFDYAHGLRVAESLRGSIVADALRARKNAKSRVPGAGTQWDSASNPRLAGARHTLRVRVDVPDLDL